MLPIKKDIKLVRSLSQKKFRKELGLFIVEGKKMVEEAIQSNFDVDAIYSTDPQWAESNDAFLVNAKEMEQMTALNNPSPYLAVLKAKNNIAPENTDQFHLILDGISDPGNMGTILRTCEWFGIHQVVCSEDCVELYNPKVVQSTMGSIFRVNVTYCNIQEYADKLRSRNFNIYGADLEGDDALKSEIANKSVLVIGSESHGIRPQMEQKLTHKLFIPGRGEAESLNAAVATSILVAQWFRHSA
ncbi:MAG: RNA methyltransferase [Flavobacteriales bacterium]